MNRRWGLQAAMTATYVAVTAVAVLLTELAIFGVAALGTSPPLTLAQVQGLAQATATQLAAKLAAGVGRAGNLPDTGLGLPGVRVTAGLAQPDGVGGLIIPREAGAGCDLAEASLAVLISRGGTVLATSDPDCYPAGSQGSDAQAGAPRKMLALVRWPTSGSGNAAVPDGNVVWASAPVTVATGPKASSQPGPGAPGQPTPGSEPGKVLGMVYLEVPDAAPGASQVTVSPTLVWTGLAVLLAAVPVGLAFGLVSTRRLTRRLGRLADLTLEVADGDFEPRVPVCGHDEVSRLEENFNRMAGQLESSVNATRQLAGANARHQERSRIARELHDSISQELFSLSILAGGLRRTLPAGFPGIHQVETMERTAGNTMREMRSLLLALRPVALEDASLADAIESVCHDYGNRLGIPVRTQCQLAGLGPAGLAPSLEHAVLRVTQEAVANAARHADPGQVTVRLRASGGNLVLEVTDDGRGFDTSMPGTGGLGLHTMRDRVAELGGQLTIASTPGEGTVVCASLPVQEAR